MKRMTNNRCLSLYVHAPFCRSKCPYCAFYSFAPRSGQMERWLACLAAELETIKSGLGEGESFSTVYIGGGPPSYLPLALWRKLLGALGKVPREPACEFTVEANPESVDEEKLALWKDFGVTRVSVGVQSLDDRELKTMARPHDSAQALRILELCMKKGFRVSADLIFGLPRQTLRRWHESMSKLVAEGVTHLSVYQLMIEDGSFWGRCRPSGLPDGYPMYRWAQYYLPRQGLKQYEIASFAVPGFESRHNRAYWKRSDVYAAGPAAWGFLGGVRFANCRSLARWAERIENGQSPVEFREKLSAAQEASEAAILALRTSEGIHFEEFAARYGKRWLDAITKRLRALPEADFVWSGNGVALSPRGMRVGNSIWTELMDLER